MSSNFQHPSNSPVTSSSPASTSTSYLSVFKPSSFSSPPRSFDDPSIPIPMIGGTFATPPPPTKPPIYSLRPSLKRRKASRQPSMTRNLFNDGGYDNGDDVDDGDGESKDGRGSSRRPLKRMRKDLGFEPHFASMSISHANQQRQQPSTQSNTISPYLDFSQDHTFNNAGTLRNHFIPSRPSPSQPTPPEIRMKPSKGTTSRKHPLKSDTLIIDSLSSSDSEEAEVDNETKAKRSRVDGDGDGSGSAIDLNPMWANHLRSMSSPSSLVSKSKSIPERGLVLYKPVFPPSTSPISTSPRSKARRGFSFGDNVEEAGSRIVEITDENDPLLLSINGSKGEEGAEGDGMDQTVDEGIVDAAGERDWRGGTGGMDVPGIGIPSASAPTSFVSEPLTSTLSQPYVPSGPSGYDDGIVMTDVGFGPGLPSTDFSQPPPPPLTIPSTTTPFGGVPVTPSFAPSPQVPNFNGTIGAGDGIGAGTATTMGGGPPSVGDEDVEMMDTD